MKRFAAAQFTGLALATAASIVVFALCYPTHFLIADEWRYFEQARAWANGASAVVHCQPCPGACTTTLPGEYPAGTALLSVAWIWTGGLKAVFWQSLTCGLIGLWAIALCLHRIGAGMYWVAYPVLFLPALVLTRTLMSDLPSFMVAALFLWAFTGQPKSRARYFLAGCFGGLGVLFRETNILWALPFLFGALVRKGPYIGHLWSGFFTGLLPRVLTGAWFFGDPFFFKDPGMAFRAGIMPVNLLYYGFALLVLLPGGLWLWWKSNHPLRTEIGVCVGLFLLVYSCYDYPAFIRSGYKGLVLQGRFLIPILPFLTLSAATSATTRNLYLRFGLPGVAMMMFSVVQMVGWRFNQEQNILTAALYRLPAQTHISFSPDESIKYVNALYGPKNIADGQLLFPVDLKCQSTWYVHLFDRKESADRKQKARTAEERFFRRFKAWNIEPRFDQQIADGTRLRIWRVQQPDSHE